MFSYATLIAFLSVLSGLYSLPYGNWEFKNKNILSGIVIYVLGTLSMFLGIYQSFI